MKLRLVSVFLHNGNDLERQQVPANSESQVHQNPAPVIMCEPELNRNREGYSDSEGNNKNKCAHFRMDYKEKKMFKHYVT